MKRAVVSVFLFLGVVASGAAQSAPPSSLGDLFARAKTEFARGAYEDSLETLRALDAASRKEGLETSRQKLAPAIAFYRGVDLAALGRDDEAAKEFEAYRAASAAPAARLDPAVYPRAVVDLYRRVREKSVRASPSGDAGLAEEFSRFRATPGPALPIDEKWADGAIRFLMSRSEKEAWKRLDAPVGRAEFVAAFWLRRDPNPQTPENEYRQEIERRVQFADKRFVEGETKGGETDRGMVFVLFGPPSYVGQQPLKSEDDPVQAARAGPLRELRTSPDGSTSTVFVPRTGLTAERLQGTREVWHYRRDRLPASVRFPEVDFEFLTKPGYGVAVLQRNPDVLAALDQAVERPKD